MRLNPVMFKVEFTGDGPAWASEVEACSRDQAIILAAAKATEDKVFLGIATKVTVARLRPRAMWDSVQNASAGRGIT